MLLLLFINFIDLQIVPDTPKSLSKLSRDSKESTPMPTAANEVQPIAAILSDTNIDRGSLKRENSNESDKEPIDTERRTQVVRLK